ncbi:MAG: SIMPL domain-containing protein [Rhizobiales bacterium]|nr:SIMPL domain-containing protein [Hyphomicrobiales bacterium]
MLIPFWPARAAAVIAFAVTALPAQAAVERPFPLVTVTGEGTVTTRPDIAQATAGVSTEGKTPREASDANAKAMTAVVAALKEAGIQDNDIRTVGFNISTVNATRPREGQPTIVGYRVSNNVSVRVRDIAALGGVLDKLVAAGANEISGIDFTVADPKALRDRARDAAVADAKRKAEQLAAATGATLGRAVTIDEGEAGPMPLRRYSRATAMMATAAPPMEPGEETIRVQVTISFEMNH